MRPTHLILGLCALTALAACSPPVPDSGAGARGAGFDTPAQVAERQRQAQLSGQTPIRPSATVQAPPPGAIVQSPAPMTIAAAPPASEAQELAAQTRAALGQSAAPAPVQSTPIQTAAAQPAPLPTAAPVDPAALDLDRNNPELSSEQSFEVVSAERDIQTDAERLRAARQQYQLVTPVELQRPDSTGPNIFAYALGPARPVGTNAFRRGLTASARRAAENCQNYRSDDIAQEDFLASGGPERDRLGLDPDGDGNACGWDPAVVRRLVQSQ